MSIDPQDVRIMTPQIRRSLEPGVASGDSIYTDDDIKFFAADAVSLLILCGGIDFPYSLVVASADVNNYPVEYKTNPALPIEVQALVSLQASIQQTLHELNTNLKMSETIQDEGSKWDYKKSVALLKDKLKAMISDRDKIMDQINRSQAIGISFINILETRNEELDRAVESYWYA